MSEYAFFEEHAFFAVTTCECMYMKAFVAAELITLQRGRNFSFLSLLPSVNKREQ